MSCDILNLDMHKVHIVLKIKRKVVVMRVTFGEIFRTQKTWVAIAILMGGLGTPSSFAAEASAPLIDFDGGMPSWSEERCGENSDPGVLCNDKHRLFIYSAHNPSNSQGFIRYGGMEPSAQGAVSDGLKLVFTAGQAYDDSNVLRTYGIPVNSFAQLTEYEDAGVKDLYAKRDLPGVASIYYKHQEGDGPLGVFDGDNRFSMYVWYPAAKGRYTQYSRVADKSVTAPEKTLALYPFIGTSKGAHYYHHATNRAYGGWVKVQFDAHPTHKNTGPYTDRHDYAVGGDIYPGDGVRYFNDMAAFSIVYHGMANKPSPYTFFTDEWERYYVEGENDETIANVGIGYDPNQRNFDLSLEDKFRCGDCNAKYEIRYSFVPITTPDFEQASPVRSLENFFVEDNNPENLLVKPNGGYNQVWGKFSLKAGDVERFEAGETLYVAIKDVSQRSFEVDAATKDAIAKIKTISFDYAPPPESATLSLPDGAHAYPKKTQSFGIEREGDIEYAFLDVESDYGSDAWVEGDRDGDTVSIYAYREGSYKLHVETNPAGTERPVTSNMKVHFHSKQCQVNQICAYSKLADFEGETVFRYSEMSLWSSKAKTKTNDGLVGAGNAVISGSGFSVSGEDKLVVVIRNPTEEDREVRIRLTGKHELSYSASAGDGWYSLPKQLVRAGETLPYYIAAQSINSEVIKRINFEVDDNHVAVASVGVLRKEPLRCSNCSDVLVDFNADGVGNRLPYTGWDTVFSDAYTGPAEGGGYGIVVGSNGKYNYQGVKSNYSFPSGKNHAEFIWKNTGDKAETFTPQYSFDDPDRPGSGAAGSWLSVGEMTLEPGQSKSQTVKISYGAKMVNTNVNKDQRGTLILDKIMVKRL